ncbi:hypothetical protein [Actinoplanes sp. URMC 104]|uniref:hypothetical protein n=1 Tax=Actinoplanes sp. URMC 104 TaxID=3423409 RepID=UPI003F1B96F5
MIFAAAVPKVDVITDRFDWWNAGVGTAGVLIAIAAITIAIRADKKADRILAEERRRVFELEVLRELAKEVDEGKLDTAAEHPSLIGEYRLRLRLLSNPPQFWIDCLDKDTVAMMDLLGRPEYRGLADAFRSLEARRETVRRLAKYHRRENAFSPDELLELVVDVETDLYPADELPPPEGLPRATRITKAHDHTTRTLRELDSKMKGMQWDANRELVPRLAEDLEKSIKQLIDPPPRRRPPFWLLAPWKWSRTWRAAAAWLRDGRA